MSVVPRIDRSPDAVSSPAGPGSETPGPVATDAAPVSRESAPANTHSEVFALLGELSRGGAVLDLPCGSGAFTRRLLAAGYRVTGGDVQAHPAVPPEVFRLADMNRPLPFAEGAFECVASIEGIEHIQRPFDFIRECHRVLAPGGVLLLTTPNIGSLRSRWRWFLTGFHNKCKHPLDETRPEPRHHINMCSYPELRYMLHTSGFRLERVATNRVKPISWVYAPWIPLTWLVSAFFFAREVDGPEHRRVTDEVLRDMHSRAVLFGETLILVARKEG